MYLADLDNGYSTLPDTSEQAQIYGYIRGLATQPSQDAISAFYRLIRDGNAQPNDTVNRALKQVVGSPQFSQSHLQFINRCYYTLANPWHLEGDRDRDLESLILNLETLPLPRAHNPTTRKLRNALQLYRDNDYYTILRKHLRLLTYEQEEAPEAQAPTYFGDLFSDYFFIYEAGTQTPDIEKAAGELNHGILEKRNQRLKAFQQELTRFYVRYRRSDEVNRINPTHLSDTDLARAFELYSPKRNGGFRAQAKLFHQHEQEVRSVDAFKELLYEHVMRPILQLSPIHRHVFNRVFRETLNEFDSGMPLTRIVRIQIFRRILNTLMKHDAAYLDGSYFYRLVNGQQSHLVTSILLNIVLACQMVRFDLEKRLAYIHHKFANAKNEMVAWLVTAFDHMNVALALNAQYLDYFKLNSLDNSMFPDSV